MTILPPDAYFYSVTAAGVQVGVGSITVDTLSDGVRVTERLGLDLPIHSTSSRSQFTSEYTIGNDLRLREFRLTMPGNIAPIIQQGIREGDSVFFVSSGTGEPRRRVPVRPTALTPPSFATVALALQQRLRVGEQLQIPVFDPATLGESTVRLTVLDDSVFLVPDSAEYDSVARAWLPVHSDTLRAWKIDWRDGPRQNVMWVDIRGLPIRVLSPAGLEFDRSAFEIVNTNYRQSRATRTGGTGSRPSAIIPRSAIASGVEPAAGVSGMRVRLTAQEQPWVPTDSAGGNTQVMIGDTLVPLNPQWSPELATYELPSSDTLLPRWRTDDPLLGIHDSGLASQARTIVGGERNPARAAERLVHWVSRNITRTSEAVVPRAGSVLRNRSADVDGHTVLFVALARAAGLPARSVSGLLLAGDRFYFHSWAEVFIGHWAPVDPAWAQVPAGVGRIRVATGGLSRPLELLPLVAGLQPQLLSITRRP